MHYCAKLYCLWHTEEVVVQAANIEAETSGIHDGDYQLTKHEYSGIGRGKYSGTVTLLPSFFMHECRYLVCLL